MMRWFRRAAPAVTITPFADAPPRLFAGWLCDGVTITGLTDLAGVLRVHGELAAARPDCRVLISLDDVHQAAYTAGHAIERHDLDCVAGHDLTGLPPECFADGAHRGWFTTPAEFPLRLANLLARAADTGIAQVRGTLFWETPGDDNSPLIANSNPAAPLGLRAKAMVAAQFVPVTRAADALAAFPNGYFAADLTPMQNHALALHLEAQFGLALFGIGASLLGFRRAAPLSAAEASAVAGLICDLYRDTPASAAAELAQLLTGRDWLLLRYSES